MAITQLGYHETLVNNVKDQITAAINDTDTSIGIADASSLPTTGFFRGQIDDEIIYFDGRSGNTLNVATNGRGFENTTAVSHLINAPIEIKLTAEGFQRFMLDHFAAGFTEESTVRAMAHNRFLDETNTVLQVSDFTWFNKPGSEATATDINGGIYMTIQDEANYNLRGLVLPLPATPYRALVKVNMGIGMGLMDNTGTHAGLVLRESGTGKLTTASVRYGGRLALWNWDSPTSFNGFVDTVQSFHEDAIWLRIDDDGVDISMRSSNIGLGYSKTADPAWWTQSRTAFMAGGPDEIGIYLNSGTNSGSSGAGPSVAHVTFEAFRLEEL